ncbi:MAG: glycosyl hydrolase, partial [Gemmatimonadota bacterium]|nr:glycosyl hydrolase [Gemmatimonadota bacterium]
RISPHDPDIVYHTSQFVHRTRDGGYSWETISPDLTRNDTTKQGFAGGRITRDNTGVEVYGTIFAFEESPHEQGVLWAGSDDGLIHVSRDDGETWQNVTPPGLPAFSTVNMIDLSAHAAGRAHVAVYRYRMADYDAYMYRTDDYGETWTRLGTAGIEPGHFVRVVREDPERQGLLFAGTEQGLYVSLDGGERWQRFQRNLPVTPVTDLQIHRGDLVVGTQGRSFWILDDFTPLRHATSETLAAGLHLYPPRSAVRAQGVFPNGAPIYFSLAEEPEETVNLQILSADGRVVRVYSTDPGSWDDEAKAAVGRGSDWSPSRLEAEAGLNRLVWGFDEEGPDLVEGARIWGFTGRVPAVPGTYEVRLAMGEMSQTRELEVEIDPRVAGEVTVADLQAQHDLMVRVRDMLQSSHDAVRDIRSIRSQMSDVARTAEEAGYGDAFVEMAEQTGEKLTAVEEELFQTQNESSQDPLNFPPMLDNQIAALYGYILSTYDRPNEGAFDRAGDVETQLDGHLDRLQTIIETDVAEFNRRLREAGVPAVIVKSPPRATS